MNVKSKKHLFTFLLLCIAYKIDAQITILPVFGDKPITENTWFVTKNGDSIQFDNIRFYLSDIQFEMNDKSFVSDTVKAHLVDVFEPNTLKIGLPKIDFTHIKTLRFNIGIDSLTNVSGALNGDLDPQRGMYWAWQSGYINIKIEGRSPQCKSRKNAFQFHLGGYLPPFYALKSIELPINAQNTDGTSREIREGGITQIDRVILNHPINSAVQKPKSDILNPKYTEGGVLTIDFDKFFEPLHIATQNSIMMPCKEAMQLADYSLKMFSWQTHEK